MSAFGGSRSQAPKPPEKGIFPLDHFAECKEFVRPYVQCLRERTDGDAAHCAEIAKKYLKCRMDKGLMAPQSLSELGFKDEK